MINEIAEKIASLRKQKGFTLKEVSDRTGLSISFLSQIENGSSSLAITSLKKIADALEVSMIYFFDTDENRMFHVRTEDQKTFQMEGSGHEYIRMSGSFADRSMEALIVMMPSRKNTGQKFSHVGEEFVYVLEGELVVEIDGTEYMVKAGESMHYPSTTPHVWNNPGATANKLLCVLMPRIL